MAEKSICLSILTSERMSDLNYLKQMVCCGAGQHNFDLRAIEFECFPIRSVDQLKNFTIPISTFMLSVPSNQIQLQKLFVFNILNLSWSIHWIVFVGYLYQVKWNIISFRKGSNIPELKLNIRPIYDCGGPKINHSLNQFRHFDMILIVQTAWVIL